MQHSSCWSSLNSCLEHSAAELEVDLKGAEDLGKGNPLDISSPWMINLLLD